MKNKKCFLNNCSATLADWLNHKCECLVCVGQNQDDCKVLQDERKFKAQQIICQSCKNCICK